MLFSIADNVGRVLYGIEPKWVLLESMSVGNRCYQIVF